MGLTAASSPRPSIPILSVTSQTVFFWYQGPKIVLSVARTNRKDMIGMTRQSDTWIRSSRTMELQKVSGLVILRREGKNKLRGVLLIFEIWHTSCNLLTALAALCLHI